MFVLAGQSSIIVVCRVTESAARSDPSTTVGKSRVLAVFVTYNPDNAVLAENIKSVLDQGCDCYVVDNASAFPLALKPNPERVTVDLQATNLGLGSAQNIGLRAAQNGNYDYAILFDQDSLPDSNMIESLLRAHKKKSQSAKVAAVGPVYRNAQNGTESFFVKFGYLKFKRAYKAEADEHGCIDADFLISSGSLCRVEALNHIGLMDESLFIDHVDTEWFLRSRALGYQSFGVADAMMGHELGEDTHQVSLGGRKRNVPQHKPFRYYYIFRNSVLLYKRRGTSWLWKWNDLQRLVLIAVMFGVFKAPRLSNLSMMLKGAWHGIIGRSGKLVEYAVASDKAK